jgi:cathepsin B
LGTIVPNSRRIPEFEHPRLPSLQVKTLMGALPETKETKPAFRPVEEYDDVEVPVTFDARTAWPKCKSIAHIRDQSTCGSCWAFGGVEAMSDRVCIASNGTVTDELSAEDVLSCCGFTCGDGCNGGYPSSAWHFFMKHGLTTEAKYPYAFPPCEHHINASHYKPCGPSQPTPKCSKAAIKGPKYHGKSVYSVLPTTIEKEIMQNGPVEGGFTVYQGL